MNRMFRLARRAAQASPHEWWTRSSQLAFAIRNYVGSRDGGSALSSQGHRRALKTDFDELGGWWANRRTQWFIDSERVAKLRSASTSSASNLPWVLARAEDVLVDRLPLFAHGAIDFTGPDRWHRDFVANKTAPRKFHGFVPYLDHNVVGDSKHVWEPNRFAWAIWLGIAYRITGEAKYADKFRQWTADWFRCNPYPMGINYCSALEVAYRNYAWLWSLSLFSDYLEMQSQLLDDLLRGIWIGSRHIEENLSTYFAPNTHILGEAFGLFAVGAAIPEFRDSARWRKRGLAMLEAETYRQFFQDGMHRELSSCYHIYTSDIYLQAVQIGRESGHRVPAKVEETAKLAARRLAELVPHDLMMPQFNDCDGGRVTSLVPNPLDAGPTLMAAEDIFPNESFLLESTETRGYPLLMTTSDSNASRRPLRRALTSIPIDRDLHRIYDSGLASYRSNDGDYALLRASEFGYLDCPHSHDAGLGVILYLNHAPVVVDSGVGAYTQSKACRNTFRSATGKNTILVGGHGPSKPDGWFSWQETTDCELVSVKRFIDGFTARGKHRGFSHAPDCYTFVQREIIMLDFGIIAIVDRWDSDEEIAVESRFTLSPQLELDSEHNMLLSADGTVFHFAGLALGSGEGLESIHNEEPYSADYGLVSKTNAISYRHRSCQRGGIVTFVSRRGPALRIAEGIVIFQQSGFSVRFTTSLKGIKLTRTNPVEQLN